MPYITKEARDRLKAGGSPNSAGELNFMFAALIVNYLGDCGTSYQTFNDIVGALECCKLEVYRRLAAPYEDSKIKENGDVL